VTGRIGAADLEGRLRRRDGELALLDAREQGVFFGGHLFWASCVPLSQLELLVADLVPRRTTPVVICDGDGADDGPAARAAARMTELGWLDVCVLEGGLAAWPYTRYSGVNVPSKAFGEWVERHFATPHLSASELRARVDAGERLVVLDSRPMREFRRMSIPGAIDCPGAELVYRVHDLLEDDTTTVVVNCAGRTRSILGAQSLRNAGLPNPVFALEGGTMGWELAGFEVAGGCDGHAPLPSEAGLEQARRATGAVAATYGVAAVEWSAVAEWTDDPERTTYLFDVRSPEEFAEGHQRGARSAPGGQLVQATDEYVGVLGARLVLVDEGSGVRATMTASWLRQLGAHEVVVLAGGVEADGSPGPTEQGPWTPTVVGAGPVPTVAAADLTGGETVVDLADSLRYRRGHLPGAWWAVRSRLDEAAEATGPARDVVLTSPDGRLAALAVPQARRAWSGARVAVLAGGTAAWPGPLVVEDPRLTSSPDDVWYKPYDAEDRDVAHQHMRDYLTWEVALLEQIDDDETVCFGGPVGPGGPQDA
jgi:rhodanese-related sulfurtransferase